jgi:hypothetical protein
VLAQFQPVEEDESCPICGEEICVDKATIQCSHTFCFGCISECVQHANTCPICRKRIRRIDAASHLCRVILSDRDRNANEMAMEALADEDDSG